MTGEVRPIQWAYFSPEVQAHGQCRYCHRRAEWMRVQEPRDYRLTGHWVALCAGHAGKEATAGEISNPEEVR